MFTRGGLSRAIAPNLYCTVHTPSSKVFMDVPPEGSVWMYHQNLVYGLPPEFSVWITTRS
jgi:GMP synthase-like glutamine amidotransferase